MGKISWWKWLGVALILYTFTAGMLVPLQHGIVEVTPRSARTGEQVTLELTGYNSNYDQQSESLKAWLKLDDEKAIGARSIEVLGPRRLAIGFDLPAYLPVDRRVQDFSLILDSKADGTAILPTALLVTQDSIDPEKGIALWANTPVSDLTVSTGMTFPFRPIIYETIRNTYFHVALWLSMMLLFIAAVVYSVRYVRNPLPEWDSKARAFTSVGLFFGILGLVTGMVWAKYTWGQAWSNDVKQITTAIALLVYLAYFILRSAFEDPEQRGRISAVYNIFAFALLIPLIYVIPRMVDSLHPGAGGNPAFGSEDLDNTMRMIFYPAIIGWALIGAWIANLQYRLDAVREEWIERMD